jgi:hypothetical protein
MPRISPIVFATVIAVSLAFGAACSSSHEAGPDNQGGTGLQDAAPALDSWTNTPDAPVAPTPEAASEAAAGNQVDSAGDDSGSAVAETGPSTAPDAGPDTSIESIQVSGSGTPASFKTTLTQGALYLLKAVGSADVGGQKVDAEYAAAADGSGATDLVGMTDVGIDVGLLQPNAMNHTTKVPDGPGRMKWYGSFRANHTYFMWVTGQGNALSLKLVTPASGGSGTIAVSLFELGPPPPAMYTLMNGPKPPPPAAPKIGRPTLDTIQVPLMKTVVMSKIATDKNAIYLLQASGAGQVSRGVIAPASPHMGDANYMDWPLDGSKFNDGECGAEFGIGVDEPQGPAPCTGGILYTHRKNWWGPFRNDHIYYMLFAGTGMPISFLYYDSGYGDNSPTETLTVQVFPVP